MIIRFWLTIFWLIIASIMCAQAEIMPSGYPTDPHIQVANYDPNQVYKIFTMQGYITTIAFGIDEKIIAVNVGDSSSWLVNVQNEAINLKPIANHPDTNMNVLTSRGNYQFFLTAPEMKNDSSFRKPDLKTAFLVKFHYPNEEDIWSHQRKSRKTDVSHFNYTAQGDPMVVPICVYDNGRFTFFHFGNHQDIPAIFSVNKSGNESLVNYHIQDQWVVVEAISQQFTLRNGDQVASIFNETPA